MEDRGEVMSIKFSPDRKILAIQRSQKSVVGRVLQLLHYELGNISGRINACDFSKIGVEITITCYLTVSFMNIHA